MRRRMRTRPKTLPQQLARSLIQLSSRCKPGRRQQRSQRWEISPRAQQQKHLSFHHQARNSLHNLRPKQFSPPKTSLSYYGYYFRPF